MQYESSIGLLKHSAQHGHHLEIKALPAEAAELFADHRSVRPEIRREHLVMAVTANLNRGADLSGAAIA